MIQHTDEDGFTDASNGVSNVGTDSLIAKYYGGKGSYMYGALGAFKSDFQTTWSTAVHPINSQWVGGTDPVRQKELAAQMANLTPITTVTV